MNLIRRESLRRMMPAFVVGSILVAAFVAQPPVLAKSTGNCGVKAYGYATHDHGKPCPNRPFPGHGIGVIRIMAGLGGSSQEDNPTTLANTSKTKSKTGPVTTSAETVIESDTSARFQSASHGHGHGSGKSHGHHGGNH